MTSAAALRAAADKLTPFHLTNYSNKLTTKQPTPPIPRKRVHENLRRRTGRFALTRLQNRPVPPPCAVKFSRFPLPPLFPFSERPLLHGSSRKSMPKNCRLKLLYSLFVTVPLRSCFLFYTHCLRHMYAPIFLFSVDLRKLYLLIASFPPSRALCLLPEKGKFNFGGINL